MDTSKYIPNSLDNLGKDGLGKAKVAISFARLKTDRRHLVISVLSVLIAALGIGIGIVISSTKSAELQREILKTETTLLKAEVTLRFLDTPRRERLAYVQLVRELDILDEDVLNRLETAAREDGASEENAALLIGGPIDDQTITGFEAAMNDLTSGSSNKRRQARAEIHELILTCGAAACLEYFDEKLNPNNILTGESYRRALGIAVALSQFTEDEVRRFDAYSGRAALLEKLQDLLTVGEPAIENAAKRALAVWSG